MKHDDRVVGVGAILGIVSTLGVAWALIAQVPSSPTLGACSGSVQILVNGAPLSSGCVINFVSGTAGIILSAAPNPAIGGTNITVNADLSFLQTLANDESGQDHVLNAISQNCNLCTPGLAYTASLNPAMANYSTGQWFIMLPDLPTELGATVNIGGLGPITLNGTCSGACILLALGSPVNTFQVH